MRKMIPFYNHGKHTTHSTAIWVAYNNNAFYFDVGKNPEYENSTDKIVILDNGGWNEGETYHPKTLGKATDSQAQDIKIFIKYKPLPGMQRNGSHHYCPPQ